jgi:hypothetical protein
MRSAMSIQKVPRTGWAQSTGRTWSSVMSRLEALMSPWRRVSPFGGREPCGLGLGQPVQAEMRPGIQISWGSGGQFAPAVYGIG